MTKNNNLPKELEEQIQNLASDVYIQVEEKVTNLINSVVPNERVKSDQIDKNSDYLTLKDNYSLIEKELKNKIQNIKTLEDEFTVISNALNDEKRKQKEENKKLHVELTQKNIKTTDIIDELTNEVSALKQRLNDSQNTIDNQESSLKSQLEDQIQNHTEIIDNLNKEALIANQVFKNEQELNINKIELLEARLITVQKELANAQQEISALNTKMANTVSQNKILTTQLDELHKTTDLQQKEIYSQKEAIKEQLKVKKDDKQKITTISDELSVAIKQEEHNKSVFVVKEAEYQKIQKENVGKIQKLEKSNQSLSTNLLTEQADLNSVKEELILLKSQLKLSTDEQENILQRFTTSREKQEKDNDQVRETIKYLRDENSNLINEHNEASTNYTDKINDLEHKLIEYRLKFEYAQKQLNNN